MFKHVVKLIIVISIISQGHAMAEQLVSPSGGQYVLLFETKDKLDYFTKECAGKGNRAYEPDCISCVKAMVDSGTRCSIIEKTLLTRKVRIRGPSFKGKVGWVPMEMVR